MSLFLVLYVLALCVFTAAIVYGIVRPERPLHPDPAAQKRARRLAA